jgi:hypothetical protein
VLERVIEGSRDGESTQQAVGLGWAMDRTRDGPSTAPPNVTPTRQIMNYDRSIGASKEADMSYDGVEGRPVVDFRSFSRADRHRPSATDVALARESSVSSFSRHLRSAAVHQQHPTREAERVGIGCAVSVVNHVSTTRSKVGPLTVTPHTKHAFSPVIRWVQKG